MSDNSQPDKQRPADGNPTEAGGAERTKLVQANPTWAMPVIIVSCAVGATLLIVGIWAEVAATLDGILSTTFIVSGLALIFGAFGAQATVQYRGWVIAGVAATALIFLFSIDHLRRDSFVVIELTTSKTPESKIKAGNALIKGTVDSDAKDILRTRFFILQREIPPSRLRLDTLWPNKENADEKLTVSICFGRDKIVHRLGRSQELTWRLNEREMKVYDVDKRLIGSKAECGDDETSNAIRPLFGVSTAHAQSTTDIASLIEDLLSDNADVRRLSRDKLGDIGPQVVRPLMDRAIRMAKANDRLAFRMQVGAAVAIDRMITQGKSSTQATMQQQFTQSDFDAIISWTLNRDQSLLGPALRILASTSNLAALQSLLKAIESNDNENITYNTAWVLRQSGQRHRSDPTTLSAIKQLARQIRPRSPGDKTNVLLDQIEKL